MVRGSQKHLGLDSTTRHILHDLPRPATLLIIPSNVGGQSTQIVSPSQSLIITAFRSLLLLPFFSSSHFVCCSLAPNRLPLLEACSCVKGQQLSSVATAQAPNGRPLSETN